MADAEPAGATEADESTESDTETGAEAERRTDHIPEWKREEVDALVDLLERYDCVGVVNVAGIPSRQLQNMRRDLRGSAELRISRNTLVRRALETVDEGYEQLVRELSGQVGLVATDQNPFGLYRQLELSKTPAPINAGETAPDDIVIRAGDTGIDPGPFVGELQQVGANARIQEGSIRVLDDSTVLEAGEEVSAQLANVLAELDIEPKEVGLDLRAAYADGVLFERDELALDIEEYRGDVQAGAAAGRNLSVNAGFPTPRTVGGMVRTAAGEARSVGVHAAIEDPDLVDTLLARADARVRAIARLVDDEEALPEEFRGTGGEVTGGSHGRDGTESTDERETAETDQTVADQEAGADEAGADEAGADEAGADEAGADEEKADADTDADTDTDADADTDTDEDEDEGGAALGDMFG